MEPKTCTLSKNSPYKANTFGLASCITDRIQQLASKNQDMIGGQNMLQRFGNFHFGYVAAANDFTLAESMAGAGLVQHFLQDGNPINTPVLDKILDQVTDVSSEDAEEAEYLTHAGYEWFDNAGDAADILDGWNFYHEQERKN